MRSISKSIRLAFDESGHPELTLSLNLSKQEAMIAMAELKAILVKGKELAVEVKQYREKRSLNANSYCWVLIGKIAKSWQPPTPEDDVYIEMLKRYGQREPELLSVIAEGAGIVYKATKNHCCEVGESELHGKVFKHFAILRGSSEYDTKEMSVLIDGVVSEAKDLGIETMTPAELAGLKQEWGR